MDAERKTMSSNDSPSPPICGPVGNVFNKYGSRNPIVRRMMRAFLAAVGDFAQSVEPRTVLEVGCGEGELAHRLQTRVRAERFVACDLTIDQCIPAVAPIEYKIASIYDLPFERASFDLVVCCEVLEHLDDPMLGLAQITRVAKRGVLVSTPREPLWRVLNVVRGRYLRDAGNTPGHVQHFSRRRLLELCARELDELQVRQPLPWTVVLGKPKA